jgi:hypothetical protein
MPTRNASENFPTFDVLDCDPNGKAGRGGFGIGLPSSNKSLNGQKGITGILVKTSGYNYSLPASNAKSVYSVRAGIKAVIVENPGFGFSQDDVLVVEPSNGAVLRPVVKNGQISEVIVDRPGTGFTTLPRVRVKTKSGYNASFWVYMDFQSQPVNQSNAPGSLLVVNSDSFAPPKINCSGMDCVLRKMGY